MQSRNSPSQCLYESSSTSPSILWKVSLPPFILPTLMLSRGSILQWVARALKSHVPDASIRTSPLSRLELCAISPTIHHKGLDNTTVADVLMTKGERKDSLHWCRTNDTVYDAVLQMAENNVGSLVVLKPGEQQILSGIITERDYLRKIIAQGRSSKLTRVGEIMTDESKLITVSSGTNILKAMQIMTENRIRHVPVIDGKVVGMISIVDVVGQVVEQQNAEMKHLADFIKGDYF
ncbi:PREDICTED: CBS domain-containing protein CBSX3, mitochondrial [Nelumbo nucifera]|uniref:CBS domain-containing protein CBSX3, mitochondrial n=1 Tax=Nelumbo nucifera TaxID=4432 RepID=A0A1U8A143_NELNU|nr:PREDICTED: CBS domain-containing protein CBSX3, mitochondrial [Nelumbo nucifera]